MYRAILPDGDIDCSGYEQGEHGVEIFTKSGEMIAFVPYTNLIAIIDQNVETVDDRSVA